MKVSEEYSYIVAREKSVFCRTASLTTSQSRQTFQPHVISNMKSSGLGKQGCRPLVCSLVSRIYNQIHNLIFVRLTASVRNV